jgi:hypothetical protein
MGAAFLMASSWSSCAAFLAEIRQASAGIKQMLESF